MQEKTPAQIANENGWAVGSILIHHQTSANLDFEITAIGHDAVMGCRASIPPASGYSRREFLLTLDDGRWSLAKSVPQPPMQWTTKFPTKPGCYWVKNYSDDEVPELLWGLSMVLVKERAVGAGFDFYFIGHDNPRGEAGLITAEWYGPIEPPE